MTTTRCPRFWMVYNCTTGGWPTVRHPTHQSATHEAARMAIAHPGETFAVMEAITGFFTHPRMAERVQFVKQVS